MKIKLLFLFSFVSCYVLGQQGGAATFHFLGLSPASYSHAMGGSIISVASNDLSTALQNPATRSTLSDSHLSFNYQFHFSGVGSGTAAYGNYWKKANIHWHTAIQFLDYGEFKGADEWGNRTGEFTAGDYALIVGASRKLNEKFQIGLNTKFIYSRLENYIATGIGVDVGAHYDLGNDATLGLVAKNMGLVTKAYAQKGDLLPFDLQLGFSKKLQYLPFRYTITAHHLYKWDVRFDDPRLRETNLFGEVNTISPFAKFSDNLFRHFIFGGEFLLGKKENLKLRFAYNHMLRRELAINGLRSFNGFSGGVEFKVKQFFVAYSFGLQHIHGSTKMISLSTHLSSFVKKK